MPRDLNKIYLYHITDVENLRSILQAGCLHSDAALIAAKGGPQVVIGYDHIKQRRLTQTRVDCCGGRFVGEFVPFYFCARSPMLYTLNQGNVAGGPAGCQESIVHLRTTVAAAIAVGNEWAFSDASAAAGYPDFFDDVRALDKLDWEAINAKYWSGRATAKAAEFLVHGSFPLSAFTYVGCHNPEIVTKVSKLVGGNTNPPTMEVRRDWYYL